MALTFTIRPPSERAADFAARLKAARRAAGLSQ
jgi:hypothetical protein